MCTPIYLVVHLAEFLYHNDSVKFFFFFSLNLFIVVFWSLKLIWSTLVFIIWICVKQRLNILFSSDFPACQNVFITYCWMKMLAARENCILFEKKFAVTSVLWRHKIDQMYGQCKGNVSFEWRDSFCCYEFFVLFLITCIWSCAKKCLNVWSSAVIWGEWEREGVDVCVCVRWFWIMTCLCVSRCLLKLWALRGVLWMVDDWTLVEIVK